MKTKYLFIGLLLVSLTGCVEIDRFEYRPEYYIANHSNANVCLIYTLQPGIAEQGLQQTDMVEINANDTAYLDFKDVWDKLNLDRECKPAGLFSTMMFTTKSGDKLLELSRINNTDWVVCHGEGNFTCGWLYEFKE